MKQNDNRWQLSDSAVQKLEYLINKAIEIEKTAPNDRDENGNTINMWGDFVKTKAQYAIQFFRDHILYRDTPLSKQSINAIECYIHVLSVNPLEAFETANSGTHPIRNALITNEIDKLEEEDYDDDPLELDNDGYDFY